MDRRKRLNRFLCFLLIFAMVMPIVSFATSEEGADTTTDDATTGTEAGTEEGGSSANEELAVSDDEAEKLLNEITDDIQATSVIATKQESIKDHKFAFENDKFELYIKEDNLSVLIRCKDNGAVIESTADEREMNYQMTLTPNMGEAWNEFFDSGVVVELMVKTEEQTRFASGISAFSRKLGVKNASKTYEYDESTKMVTCHVSFADYGIQFDVQLKLTEDGVEYYVPGDSIRELTEASLGTYAVRYMWFFPLMGKSLVDAREGYMILPDGNGITIDLVDNERKYGAPWASRVYGTSSDDIGQDGADASASVYTAASGRQYRTSNDPEKVTMPVYGMVYTDTQAAVLCSLEEGAESVKLSGNMNGAQNHFWNYIAAQYIVREIVQERTDSGENAAMTNVMQDDRQIDNISGTFIIETGDSASYAGLAIAYREYLLKKGELKEVATSYKTRVQMLGVDKEDFLVFKRNVVMTTLDDMEEIINTLEEKGAGDLLVIYDGWQKGGVYNLPVKKFKADSAVGGNGSVKDTYEKLADKDITLVLNQDAIRINPDTSSTKNSIKKIDKSSYTERQYASVYNEFKVAYPEVARDNLLALADDLKNDGISAIGVQGMSDSLFAYSKKNVEYSRSVTKQYFEEAISGLKEEGFYTALEAPYKYLWKYTDAFLDLPIYSSGYIYASNEIPFMSIVLKGVIPMYSEYVNFEANAQEFYLKLAETGVYPSFYITKEAPSELSETNSDWIYSSEADAYYDTVTEYAEAFKELADAVDGAKIADHKIVGNVTVTAYDNGVKVYVNYGQGTTVDGVYLQAKSFEIVK